MSIHLKLRRPCDLLGIDFNSIWNSNSMNGFCYLKISVFDFEYNLIDVEIVTRRCFVVETIFLSFNLIVKFSHKHCIVFIT